LVPRARFVGSVRPGRLGFCGSMPGSAIIWLNLAVSGRCGCSLRRMTTDAANGDE
jgi:hypothetical protein